MLRRAQYGSWDSFLSLCGAFFVNAAILILAAAAFHYGAHPQPDVGGIAEAYQLLAPALGSDAARILFGVALLACGQNSAITGTLAGQVRFSGVSGTPPQPGMRDVAMSRAHTVPTSIGHMR